MWAVLQGQINNVKGTVDTLNTRLSQAWADTLTGLNTRLSQAWADALTGLNTRLSQTWADAVTSLYTRLSQTWANRLDVTVSTRLSSGDSRLDSLANLDAPISGILGPIKSIQRGTVNITTQSVINVTITSVNLGKSLVLSSSGTSSPTYNADARVRLTSPTNLEIYRPYNSQGTEYVAWEVVEFNG